MTYLLYEQKKLSELLAFSSGITSLKTIFNNLKNLRENGVTIIFISHKLDEVLEIADQISVMRSGQLIDSVRNMNVSKIELAEMMIGKSLPSPPPRSTEKKQNKIIELKNVSSNNVDGRQLFKNISFSLYGSEILGIAGVEGNGQKEVVESIIGIEMLPRGDGVVTRRPLELRLNHS